MKSKPKDTKSLTEVMASLELPWPKDVFGEVPTEDWSDIDDWLRENKGYAIDTVSGTLMRRGWANYERLLRERVSDLVEQGFVVTTDVSNPPGTNPINTEAEAKAKLSALEQPTHQEQVGGKQVDTLSVFKKDKNVLKFMKKYRYQYHVTMLPDLAELVRNAYQEGYWNGVHQYPVNDLVSNNPDTNPDTANPPGTNPINTEVRL